MQTITKLEAYSKMKLSKGKAFTATFTKKDKTERVMNCKTNIKKLIKGAEGKGLQYNPLEKLVLPVVDLQELARIRKIATEAGYSEAEQLKQACRAWRSINLQTVFKLKINGEEYRVI